MHCPFKWNTKIPPSKEDEMLGIEISKTTSFFCYKNAIGGNTGDKAKESILKTDVIWEDTIYNLILFLILR